MYETHRKKKDIISRSYCDFYYVRKFFKCFRFNYFRVKTQVELIGEEEGWVKVLYNGQEGYISADYITDEDPAEAAVE